PASSLRRDTEADKLFEIARLDFKNILAGRKPGQRQVDLLNVGRCRRSDLELAHGLAAAVEQMRAERRRRVAGTVGRHANQQPIGPRKLTRGNRPGVEFRLELLKIA